MALKRKLDSAEEEDEVLDLQIGDTVRIDGLKSAAELNGALALVQAWDDADGRWTVLLHSSGEAKRVKPQNVTKVDAEEEEEEEEQEEQEEQEEENLEEATMDDEAAAKPKSDKPSPSKTARRLNADVEEVVERLCDAAMMQRHVEAAGFDNTNVPLHLVQRLKIKEGLTWLRAIEQELQKPTPSRESLTVLSKSFHKAVSYGAGSEVIDTLAALKARVDAVETLADVECVYSRLLKIAEGRAGKKKVTEEEEAEQDLQKPTSKRPTTPFWEFLSDRREKLKAELGADNKPTAVAKLAASQWKELPDEEREPYESRYRAERKVYDEELAAWKAKKANEAWEVDPLSQRFYRMLGCTLSPVARGSLVWRTIAENVITTQPETLAPGAHFVRLERIFNLIRLSEEKLPNNRAQPQQNRMLLWYGTPLARCATSLSQGLRAPLPESPFSGYSFGKGIYFSDMVSVAAESSIAGVSDKSRAILVLAEVSLGKQLERSEVDKRGIAKLPVGYNSVFGRGRVAPSESRVLPNGVKLPKGPVVEQEVQGSGEDGERLARNEYVVYNPAQIRMRYLVEVELLGESAQEAIMQARAEYEVPEYDSTPLAGKRMRKKTRSAETFYFR